MPRTPLPERWIRVGRDPATPPGAPGTNPFDGLTGRLPGEPGPRPLGEAVALAAAWPRGPVRVLVETPLCLSCPVPAGGLPARGSAARLRTLAYRMEERLPVEAEALEVGVGPPPGPGEGGGEALMVAAERAWLGPLREALRPVGPLSVEAAGLAAGRAAWAAAGPGGGPGPRWLWLPAGAGGPTPEVIAFGAAGADARPVRWSGLAGAPDAPGGLAERLVRAGRPALLVAGGSPAAEAAAGAAEAVGCAVARLPEPAPAEGATAAAWAPLQTLDAAGSGSRAGSAAWRPWAAGLAAALVLLAAGFGARGLRAGLAAEAAQEAQDAAFRAAAPGLPLPASVPAKLRSLLAEASAGAGASTGAGAGEADAAARLRAVLSALAAPDAPEARVERLRFDPGSTALSGGTRSVADAEGLAGRFTRASPGWGFRVEDTRRADGSTLVSWSGVAAGPDRSGGNR